MPRRAITLAAAGLVLASTALTAQAAPARIKPVCNILTDATDDARRFVLTVGVDPLPNVPSLDVKSADIASTNTLITAVIRVSQLNASESAAPGGMSWAAYFTLNDTRFVMKAKSDGTAIVGTLEGATITTLKTVKAVLDTAKDEIRINAAVLDFAPKPVPSAGRKAIEFEVQTARMVPGLNDQPADLATSSFQYIFGRPSCVVPGK